MEDPAREPDPAYWHDVEALFAEALDVPLEERDAFLHRTCPGAPAVRAEVASLLDALAHSGPFLEALDAGRAAALLEAGGASVAANRRIGPYRLVRELGSGGMGTVYLAERADGQFDQQVALKLIKPGMDTVAVLGRFLHERQILARLHHPGIARLLDGGTTDRGRPYFAMEYVAGLPITHYCDAHRLDVAQRLRLFLDVCEAVQYAHGNLVVHRDLKPSNMLVTEAGAVKLLDFGIARLLEPDGETGRTALTEAGLRAMTPEYAAPEQVRGETVTTATDVYALGVVLYELLTGHRPYLFARCTLEEIVQVINEGAPERPSTAVSRVEEVRHADRTTERTTPEEVGRLRATKPERLRRRLSGDLDTVILKALHREPERRYASVEAFLEDIKRHLAGLPVQTRRDTLAYRAGRFVRRHTLGVTAAVLVVLSLVGGLAGTAWQARVAEQERDLARREADKAERVSRFLVDLFQMADPNHARGETVTLREALDSGRVWVERELTDQPALRVEMMSVMGDVYYGLGLYDQALQIWDTTLAVLVDHYGEADPEVPEILILRTKTLENLGSYEEAEATARRSLALRRRLPGDQRKSTAQTMNMQARSLHLLGRDEEAETIVREALGLFPDDLDEPHSRTVLVNTLAHVLRAQDDYAAAEALYRDILDVRRAWWGEAHPEVAQTLVNIAYVVGDQGRYAAAESLFHEGLAMRRTLQGEAHPDVAIDLAGLAALLHRKGDLPAADTLYRAALDLQGRSLPAGHPNTLRTAYALGALLLDEDRPEAAETLLHEMLASSPSAPPRITAQLKSLLGTGLAAQGRYEDAEAHALDGYAVLAETAGPGAPETEAARNRLVALYTAWGKPDEAARYARPEPP